ncbi:hypothetical protein ACVEOP_20990, partial [Escherichia coli]
RALSEHKTLSISWSHYQEQLGKYLYIFHEYIFRLGNAMYKYLPERLPDKKTASVSAGGFLFFERNI